MLGPGEDGATLAPEGVQGADLTDQQKALLLDVIGARMGMLAADEYTAKMETARAEIDDTWFAWWGPTGTLGAGYFRVVSPSIAMECAP